MRDVETMCQSLLSVCTAVHPPAIRYIGELHESLKMQTHRNWEWVIATNGGAIVPPEIADDRRVRTVNVDGGQATSKAAACRASRGEVLVRIDADDLLPSNALELVAAVPGGFRWGHWAPFHDDGNGNWNAHWYDRRYGWRYQDYWYNGHKFFEHMAWPISPLMIAGLYMQPTGCIAWTREAYFGAGGFDNEPQDSPEHRLVCRTYLNLGAAEMSYIPHCMYLYRQHGTNTSTKVLDRDATIVMHTAAYVEYVEPCFRRWCRDTGLVVVSLEDVWNQTAVESDCVGLLLTSRDDLPWDELYRVMAPGGAVLVDHEVGCEDPRFHRYHRSAAGTHFFCLKGAYAARPLGRLPVGVSQGVPVVDSAEGGNGRGKIALRPDPVPEVLERRRVINADLDMSNATEQYLDKGCSCIDIFSGVH